MKKFVFLLIAVAFLYNAKGQINYDVEIEGLRYNLDLIESNATLVDVTSSVSNVIIPAMITVGGRSFMVNSVWLRFGGYQSGHPYDYSFIRSIQIPNSIESLKLGYGYFKYHGSYNKSYDYEEYVNSFPCIEAVCVPSSVKTVSISQIRSLKTIRIPSTVNKVEHVFLLPDLDSLIIENSQDSLLWGTYSNIEYYNNGAGYGKTWEGNSQFFRMNPKYVSICRQLVPIGNPACRDFFGIYGCYRHYSGSSSYSDMSANISPIIPDTVVIGQNVTNLNGFNIFPHTVFIPKTVKKGCMDYRGTNGTNGSNVEWMDYWPSPDIHSVVFEDGVDNWESTSGDLIYRYNTIPNFYIGRQGVRLYRIQTQQLTIGPLLTSQQASEFFRNSGQQELRWVKGDGAFIKMFQSNPPQLIPPGGGNFYFDNETYVHTPLYVPRGSKQLYEQADDWKYFFNIIEFDWEAPEHLITVEANNHDYGWLDGGGAYHYGESITVSANPNNGYFFKNWTEEGGVVSTDMLYSFVVDRDRNLMANFEEVQRVNINAISNNIGFGNVEGAGDYSYGETVALIAIPNSGCSFINWAEDGLVVCSESTYSFIAERDRNLVANFGGTGVDENEESSKVFVMAKDKTILIEGANESSEVTVYNVQGQRVYTGLERKISVPSAGLYIVGVENKRIKVVVE